jgi:hypothetical protein
LNSSAVAEKASRARPALTTVATDLRIMMILPQELADSQPASEECIRIGILTSTYCNVGNPDRAETWRLSVNFRAAFTSR